ncbi:hypothetical protein, partial [Iodidimonas nitroreducens]|uniref:hypothetical protein n=1 Tax=Iodidimonas nitroreducens TaxID=1236968 RepID=UPI0028D2C7FD
ANSTPTTAEAFAKTFSGCKAKFCRAHQCEHAQDRHISVSNERVKQEAQVPVPTFAADEGVSMPLSRWGQAAFLPMRHFFYSLGDMPSYFIMNPQNSAD